MATAFAVLLAIHGLIHLLGFAKAFGFAELPQLTQPIGPLLGLVWLISAALFVGGAAALFVWPRGWWALGACAVALSMVAIVPSWTDARFGALANGLVLVGVVFGFLAHGPFSLRAEYDRDVAEHLSDTSSSDVVADADLAHLPSPVQHYLRAVGVVGRPRVRNLRVRMHGRIRGGPKERWMSFSAEQHNVMAPPARLFYLNASMRGAPVQGYHRYVGADATMRIKAAALVPVAATGGRETTQSETVTLFNDMCIMAPATLIDRAIAWEEVDARAARARFTNAGHTIRATLRFDDAGDLTNFVSADRYQLSSDGARMRKLEWSTPVGGFRSFGGVRLASTGAGRWADPAGEYNYIELTIDEVEYNVRPR